MNARLIKPDGTVAREWATDRVDLALMSTGLTIKAYGDN